jgi:hypothetical protein
MLAFRSLTLTKYRLLVCFYAPLLLIFSLAAFMTNSKPTWAISSYVPLAILSADYASKYKKMLIYGIWCALVLIAVITTQGYYPLIPIHPRQDDATTDFHGWDKVGGQITQFIEQVGPAKVKDWFILAPNYQLASQTAFALKNKYPVYSLADHIEGYHFWQNESALIGKNGLLVINTNYPIVPQDWYKCDSWHLYKTVDIIRAGLVFRQIYLYECINYQGSKRN